MNTIKNGQGDMDVRIRALASFAPIFRNTKTKFGKWSRPTGSGTTNDPFTMPFFSTSAIGTRFHQALYEFEWVLRKFDWIRWQQSAEARSLVEDHAKISSASSQQLAKLLTVLARRDHFSEGTLAEAFASKLLLAIVERAEQIEASVSKQRSRTPKSKTPGKAKISRATSKKVSKPRRSAQKAARTTSKARKTSVKRSAQ